MGKKLKNVDDPLHIEYFCGNKNVNTCFRSCALFFKKSIVSIFIFKNDPTADSNTQPSGLEHRLYCSYMICSSNICVACGAMVARLTPDQKAECSSHYGVKYILIKLSKEHEITTFDFFMVRK